MSDSDGLAVPCAGPEKGLRSQSKAESLSSTRPYTEQIVTTDTHLMEDKQINK